MVSDVSPLKRGLWIVLRKVSFWFALWKARLQVSGIQHVHSSLKSTINWKRNEIFSLINWKRNEIFSLIWICDLKKDEPDPWLQIRERLAMSNENWIVPNLGQNDIWNWIRWKRWAPLEFEVGNCLFCDPWLDDWVWWKSLRFETGWPLKGAGISESNDF